MTTCAPLAKSPNCPSQQAERLGHVQRPAVVEAHHPRLGERRVEDVERPLPLAQVGERRVALAVVRVRQHRVPVAKRCRAGVLPREADGSAFLEQRGESEVLAHAPVERLRRGAFRELAPALEQLRHLVVGNETRRHLRELEQQLAQLRPSATAVGTSGVSVSGPPRYFDQRPAMAENERLAPSLRVRSSSVSSRSMRSRMSWSASPSVATPSSASLRAYTSRGGFFCADHLVHDAAG